MACSSAEQKQPREAEGVRGSGSLIVTEWKLARWLYVFLSPSASV